jgi:hypothetical protein
VSLPFSLHTIFIHLNRSVRWNTSESLYAGNVATPPGRTGADISLKNPTCTRSPSFAILSETSAPSPVSPSSPNILPPIYFSRHSVPSADLRASACYFVRSPDDCPSSWRPHSRARGCSRTRGASRSPPRASHSLSRAAPPPASRAAVRRARRGRGRLPPSPRSRDPARWTRRRTPPRCAPESRGSRRSRPRCSRGLPRRMR